MLATSDSENLTGTIVGRYAIVSKLGCGGQGVVYLARDTALDRLVALKFLTPALVEDERAQLRFMREARAAAAVDHPNICVVHSLETSEDGQPFIAMGYCEGVTLRRALSDGVLTVADAIDIVAQVADGLGAAHAQGVIHRDVKPANVMLTKLGVKILDFGLARFVNSSQITAVGSIMGTAAYMSPEQIGCEPAQPASDVWSLGIILYEMLTGSPPFTGSHPAVICDAIRRKSIPPSTLGVPRVLRNIVFRALSRNPARRPSAAAFALALRTLQLPSDVLQAKLSTLAGAAGERPSVHAWQAVAPTPTVTPTNIALAGAADILARALTAAALRSANGWPRDASVSTPSSGYDSTSSRTPPPPVAARRSSRRSVPSAAR